MLIKYHDRADVVAEYDPATGALRVLPRPASVPFGATAGWFSILDGSCVVLSVAADGTFRLRVGAHEVLVSASTRTSWRSENGTSTLVVTDGVLDAELSYPSGTPRSSNDLTPLVETEDDDFGLFLTNLLADPERMARIASLARPAASP